VGGGGGRGLGPLGFRGDLSIVTEDLVGRHGGGTGGLTLIGSGAIVDVDWLYDEAEPESELVVAETDETGRPLLLVLVRRNSGGGVCSVTPSTESGGGGGGRRVGNGGGTFFV
jgi:hypothetical protein